VTPYRLIVVCGSRHASEANRGYIRTVLNGYMPEASNVEEPTIMHGACGWNGNRSYSSKSMRGVDRWVHEEATDLGFWVEPMPADWTRDGKKAAGPIRNRRMLDRRPDLVLAFWDGKSRGTKDTMDEARRRGIPVVDAGLVA
jgi:hypothetical protein